MYDIVCSRETTTGVIILLTVAVLLWYVANIYNTNLPPGPWGLPIVGYLPLLGPQPQETFLNLSHKYGDIFTIRMGSFTTVVVNGAEKIKEALMTNAGVFDSRPDFYTFSISKEGLTRGQYNEKWIMLHKIITNRFNRIINSKTHPLEDLLVDEAKQFLSAVMWHNGKPFDPNKTLYVTFCSVKYQIVYGRVPIVRADDDFYKMIVAIEGSIDFSMAGTCNPVEVMPWLSHIFPSLTRPIKHAFELAAMLSTTKLEDTTESFEKGDIRNLADSLVELRDGTTEMENVGLKFVHFVRVLEEIIPAGFDTTATTMRWILLCLVTLPHVQKKLFEEIDKVLGDRTPSLNDKQAMPYTEAVILEGMRFKTPIPLLLPHAAVRNAKLGGYNIPKGTPIIFNAHSVTRDVKLWSYPNAFYPEHFLTSDGEIDREKAVSIYPFGLGKRKCLGEQLARNNLFITLVSMVQRFELLPVVGEEYNMSGVIGLTDCPKPYKIIARIR